MTVGWVERARTETAHIETHGVKPNRERSSDKRSHHQLHVYSFCLQTWQVCENRGKTPLRGVLGFTTLLDLMPLCLKVFWDYNHFV